MRTRVGLILSCVSLALLAVPSKLPAEERANLFLGAGASGSSESAFRGGWGAVTTLELPMSSTVRVLVRADYHAIPAPGNGGSNSPVLITDTSWFGPWPVGARKVSAAAFLVGVRLHAPPSAVETYADALVGVGHARLQTHQPAWFDGNDRISVRDDRRDDTNVALSFGAGVKLPTPGPGRLFLDAHYDFYFVRGSHGAIIPIRLGYGFPVGKRSV